LQGSGNAKHWVNQYPSNLYTGRNNFNVGAVSRLTLIPIVKEGYMMPRKNKKERLNRYVLKYFMAQERDNR
jgi:hypothetical protein